MQNFLQNNKFFVSVVTLCDIFYSRFKQFFGLNCKNKLRAVFSLFFAFPWKNMAFLTFNLFKILEIDILKNSYFTIFKV